MKLNGDPDVNSHSYGIWFLIKKLERHNGKKKSSSTNGAGLTGCLHKKKASGSISITLDKTQVWVKPRPQHKSRYTGPDRRESGE